MKKISFLFLTLLMVFMLCSAPYSYTSNGLCAQNTNSTANSSGLTFDKTEHNFGKFSIKDGPKHCTFKYKNNTNKPIVINHVLSSCGCTNPEWSKKPVMPGESGVIKVTFLNDQGPFPFEKSLTVYTSASNKPTILRIRGTVTQK